MTILKKKRKKEKKVSFKRNLRQYFEFVKPYKWYFIFIAMLVLIVEIARLGEKFLFKILIDNGGEFALGNLLANDFVAILFALAIAFFALLVFSIVGHWIQLSLVNNFESSMMLDLKRKFFNHIVHLSNRFHTTHKTGSLISRLGRGSRALERISDFFIFNVVPLFLQVIIVGGTFLYFDFYTAIAVLVTAGLFITYSLIMNKRGQQRRIAENDAEDREKGLISDVFTNIDSVKYFGKENLIKSKFRRFANVTRLAMLKHWNFYNPLGAGQNMIVGVGTFLVILFSTMKFLQGDITIGTLAFMYTAYGTLMGPLYGFVHSIRGFYTSITDFESLFEYAEIKNDIKDKKNAPNLVIKKGAVDFKNVSFSYDKRKAINRVNLSIKPGEKIALVGHSGSGKTTLVRLLYRLYDINAGEILIDGKNIRDVKQESLRSELSIVPQECILFDDTIYNNIKFSKPDATRTEVMRAIRAAQLYRFIRELPKKENTIVGERGVKLSGGEKQRVSIARAILADKKILVLDEATSALDSQTEFEIQQALRNLMKGKTSIIIAHRLSTIMGADKIVVTHRGRISQVGKHRDLINQSGIYAKLWDLQKGGYIEE